MADEEQAKMEQSKESLLFTKIPIELRLQIYNEVFEGSQTTYKQGHAIGDRMYHNVLLPTNHRNFLLTCHQAYDEALKTYWSKTILYGDRHDTEIVFFLQSVVPKFAKLHVKHIRGLFAYDLSDHLHPLHACLHEFKSLQTIGFFWGIVTDLTRWDNPSMMQKEMEEFLKGSAWMFDGLVYDGGPTLICRLSLFSWDVPEGESVVERDLDQAYKNFFYNYHTGRSIHTDHPDQIINEEACSTTVIDNQVPTEESQQGI